MGFAQDPIRRQGFALWRPSMTSLLPSNCRHVSRIRMRLWRVKRRRTDMQHEREIDALLSSGETGSIIDRLMALPRPTDSVKNEWDRAVSSRFEVRLARQMRSQMD